METATEALRDILPPPRPKKITIERIQKVVAQYYGTELAEMISKKRNKQLVHPRHIAMYLSRKMTDASFPQIGDQFGGRDHTTVMHAIEKLEKELITDQDLEATIKLLCKNIEES